MGATQDADTSIYRYQYVEGHALAYVDPYILKAARRFADELAEMGEFTNPAMAYPIADGFVMELVTWLTGEA